MIRYFVHRGDRTELVDRLDPAWLSPESGAVVWADVSDPTEEDGEVLRSVFGLHELPVEAAFQRETQPKGEIRTSATLGGAHPPSAAIR